MEMTKEKVAGKRRRCRYFALAALIVLAAAVAIVCFAGKTWDAGHDRPLHALLERAEYPKALQDPLERAEYPEALRALAEKNPDAADFVAQYPKLKDGEYLASNITLDDDYTAGEIPHLMQWDLRWGYAQYGDDMLGLTGCGPTCLSMVVAGLTGDTQCNPLAVADYSDSQGWYVSGVGTSWDLMRSGAEHFDLRWQELPLDESVMRQALDAGGALILSMLPGDFTESGHFIVICGCTADGFTVLDPNSYARSKVWSYTELRGQIGNLWAYTA